MHTNREILEAQLETCEDKRDALGSYLKELKTMCDKHNTPNDACTSERAKAVHDLTYYEAEVARIKQELGTVAKTGPLSKVVPAASTLLPQTRNQGIGAVVLLISFIAGAFLGSTLKSGKSKDR